MSGWKNDNPKQCELATSGLSRKRIDGLRGGKAFPSKQLQGAAQPCLDGSDGNSKAPGQRNPAFSSKIRQLNQQSSIVGQRFQRRQGDRASKVIIEIVPFRKVQRRWNSESFIQVRRWKPPQRNASMAVLRMIALIQVIDEARLGSKLAALRQILT